MAHYTEDEREEVIRSLHGSAINDIVRFVQEEDIDSLSDWMYSIFGWENMDDEELEQQLYQRDN